MSLLIDTNVLLRIAQVSSPDHLISKSAVLALDRCDVTLCIVPQVIYEFWVAATRPVDSNGLGMDVPAAQASVLGIIQSYDLRKDERGIFGRWHSLVVTHSVRGKGAHDARLVAAMHRHGIGNLLTFNKQDFIRFPDIAVFTPTDVISGLIPTQ